jgi:uncharacterized protein YbbC (DUF1343 family)
MRTNIILICLIQVLTVLGYSQENITSRKDSPVQPTEAIITGAERTELYLPLLQGKKVALCGNQTSLVGKTHLADTLVNSGVKLVKIFCPEHGFRGEAEAGAHIQSSVDSKTGIPIVSLYGSNKKPTAQQMAGIDIIIFDIQDVGCRFYTYISTLHYVMESAAECNVQVIIFDRPNPNGYFVDGPVLQTQYSSFVGMHPVPVVHGMTIGEYGSMINQEGWLKNNIKCNLTVIPMKNYTHSLRYSLPVSPSPNLQTDEAIYLYPSLCLFEGTAISVGRGTDIPFQVYGHPSLTAGDYYFTPEPIKGVSENPPLKGLKCRGYNLSSIAKALLMKENHLSINYLIEAYQHFPDKEKFFSNGAFFDKLAGNSTLRQQIINQVPEKEIRASWQSELANFKIMRKKYLLYPDFE